MILVFAKLFSFFLFLTRLAWVIVCPIRNEKDLPDGRSQLEGDSDAVAFYKRFKLILRKHPYFTVFLFWRDKYPVVHQWWSSGELTGNLPRSPVYGIFWPKLILYRAGNIANLVFSSLFPRVTGGFLAATSSMDYIQYLKSCGLSYDTLLWPFTKNLVKFKSAWYFECSFRIYFNPACLWCNFPDIFCLQCAFPQRGDRNIYCAAVGRLDLVEGRLALLGE